MSEFRIRVPLPEGEAIGCPQHPVCPHCDQATEPYALIQCGRGQCTNCGEMFGWRIQPSGFGPLYLTFANPPPGQ